MKNQKYDSLSEGNITLDQLKEYQSKFQMGTRAKTPEGIVNSCSEQTDLQSVL